MITVTHGANSTYQQRFPSAEIDPKKLEALLDVVYGKDNLGRPKYFYRIHLGTCTVKVIVNVRERGKYRELTKEEVEDTKTKKLVKK